MTYKDTIDYCLKHYNKEYNRLLSRVNNNHFVGNKLEGAWRRIDKLNQVIINLKEIRKELSDE